MSLGESITRYLHPKSLKKGQRTNIYLYDQRKRKKHERQENIKNNNIKML